MPQLRRARKMWWAPLRGIKSLLCCGGECRQRLLAVVWVGVRVIFNLTVVRRHHSYRTLVELAGGRGRERKTQGKGVVSHSFVNQFGIHLDQLNSHAWLISEHLRSVLKIWTFDPPPPCQPRFSRVRELKSGNMPFKWLLSSYSYVPLSYCPRWVAFGNKILEARLGLWKLSKEPQAGLNIL